MKREEQLSNLLKIIRDEALHYFDNSIDENIDISERNFCTTKFFTYYNLLRQWVNTTDTEN